MIAGVNVRTLLCAALLSLPCLSPAQSSPSNTPSAAAAQPSGILSAEATARLLPSSVLFKSQLAPVQARNSGAIRLPSGDVIVASLVDSSGYSSGVRERFQFFLYTEVPLQLSAEKVLPIGFYGAGFLADNTMVVLDVASNDFLTVPTLSDPNLKRPRPLQIIHDTAANEDRLYLGRSYLAIKPRGALSR